MTVEHTPDGHHVVVNGRKWRATDPDLPEDVSTALRHALMDARRAVKHAGDDEQVKAARRRVQLAKVALGERGTPPWWEQSPEERQQRWEAGLHDLT